MTYKTAKFLRIDGEKLKTLRLSQFKTQQQVGEAIGIGGQNIARIEQKGVGQIYRKRVPDLARFFGLHTVGLLEMIGIEDPEPSQEIPLPLTVPSDLAQQIREAAGTDDPIDWLRKAVTGISAMDHMSRMVEKSRRKEKMAPPVYTNLDTGRQMEITPPRRPKARKQAKRK